MKLQNIQAGGSVDDLHKAFQQLKTVFLMSGKTHYQPSTLKHRILHLFPLPESKAVCNNLWTTQMSLTNLETLIYFILLFAFVDTLFILKII